MSSSREVESNGKSKVKPPPRIKVSIENVDLVLQDQLQDKVDRHKSRKRQERHRRNESIGKTPSIREVKSNSSGEWFPLCTGTDYQQYEVPLQHPLKRHQQHHQLQLDDEYSSLLPQNFSITSAYGSTNHGSARPLAPSGPPPSGRTRQHLKTHPPPPIPTNQQHPLLRNNNKIGATSPLASRGSPRKSIDNLPPLTGHRRARSGGNATAAAAASPGSGPASRPSYHRRSSSLASSSVAMSIQSEASFVSVVSDIRKSSFYTGYNQKTGHYQLQYPKESVQLSTSKELKTGWIYAAPVDNEVYEEYHRAAEETMLWDDQDIDISNTMELYSAYCTCPCPTCYHGCTGHDTNHPHRQSRKPKDPFLALPPTTFAIAIPDTIYQKVLDEVSMQSTMPCGLFYCGHHEDVDRPNILLAVVLVLALFIAMGWFAFFVQS